MKWEDYTQFGVIEDEDSFISLIGFDQNSEAHVLAVIHNAELATFLCKCCNKKLQKLREKGEIPQP